MTPRGTRAQDSTPVRASPSATLPSAARVSALLRGLRRGAAQIDRLRQYDAVLGIGAEEHSKASSGETREEADPARTGTKRVLYRRADPGDGATGDAAKSGHEGSPMVPYG